MQDYPLSLESPFEEVATISGGLWRADKICGGEDALLKLCFQAGTIDLPLHSHDYSDRVVFVVEGSGTFEFVSNADATQVIEISTGDLLMFPRTTVHSFRTPKSGLQLISYHSPFIELNDSRQWKLATSP